MSDYDRGPYTPGSEPPLAFEDRRPPPRRGPAPVTLILSLLLLIAVGGGVYLVYRGGARAPGEPPQPVGAPVRDVKIAAPPQTQPSDPAAGLSIYKDNQDTNLAAPAFVAPPEQPAPRPVAPVAAAPVAQSQPARGPSAQVLAAQTPTSRVALPAKTAAKTASQPTTQSTVTSAKAAAKPAANPPTIDKILADNSDVKSPTKPLVKPVAKTLPSAAAAQPKATSESTPGAVVVQIGAYSTKALADTAWNSAAGAAPGPMAGKGKSVTKVTRADGDTLYRSAITGFTSRADAVKLCARLQASGESCIVK